MNDLKTKRIVVTGGPGTGKTALIKSLEENGFYCVHEVIRDMTLELKNSRNEIEDMINPIASAEDPKLFNDHLMSLRLKDFERAENLNKKYVFYDRGMPDVLAYMDYFNQTYDDSYSRLCIENQYDLVLIVPPWKEIYVQDNERMENFEQAIEIHNHLENTYYALGYDVIEIPIETVTNRLNFVKNLIKTNLD